MQVDINAVLRNVMNQKQSQLDVILCLHVSVSSSASWVHLGALEQ